MGEVVRGRKEWESEGVREKMGVSEQERNFRENK